MAAMEATPTNEPDTKKQRNSPEPDGCCCLSCGCISGPPESEIIFGHGLFSLASLQAEVAATRNDPPDFVNTIGELVRPAVFCDEKGFIAVPSEENGPWDLEVSIRGKAGDEAYGQPVRVVVRFDPDLWPARLPECRFRGVFHHGLTDESGSMLMPFYRALLRNPEGDCTLGLTLQSIHNFLADPLTAWKMPAGKSAQTIQRIIDTHRRMNKDRLDTIRAYSTKVRHKALFETPAKFLDDWFDPEFLQARQAGTLEAWKKLLQEHIPGVYSFKLFSEQFCDTLVEDIMNFYSTGLPARRPNSMNAYGIILNDIGLEPLIDELQRILQPLGSALYPGAGESWDGHHCFVVRYRAGEDLGLDMHTDDSDVTVNVCLGIDFTGAGLQFCGLVGARDHRKHSMTYKHLKGSCIIHLGRRRHGADDITSGERLNLILWNHSSAYRQTLDATSPRYLAEEGNPDALCVSYTHDRDFGNFKEYPKGKEHFRGRGWCPRRLFEYEGFEPDCDKEQLSD